MLIRATRQEWTGGACACVGSVGSRGVERTLPLTLTLLLTLPLTLPLTLSRRIEKGWKLAPDSTEGIERVEVLRLPRGVTGAQP